VSQVSYAAIADLRTRVVRGSGRSIPTVVRTGDIRRATLGAVFILYAIPIGIVLGYIWGGRLERLGAIRFAWGPLAIGGLLVQVFLFTPPIEDVIGDLGPPIYVISTAAVLAAVLRNWRIPGLPIVALGAASNLAAILANGGLMPTSPEAVAALGLEAGDGFSNSVVMTDPALRPLTDIFVLPTWLPFANVFSVGDVLIGVGVVLVIALGMRGTGR
jgi:hypothetical protein